MKPLSYGVREVQARIGAVLKLVERGESVLVTSRGKPVAMIVAPDARLKGESKEEWTLRRLAAEGKIIPGNGRRIRRPRGFPLGDVSRQVIADRESRQRVLEGGP